MSVFTGCDVAALVSFTTAGAVKQTYLDPLGYLLVCPSLLQEVLELFCGIHLPFTLAFFVISGVNC